MDCEPFRARVTRLLRRSRQAYRLYSSVGRLPKDEQGEFAETQSAEWKLVNARLSRELSEVLESAVGQRGINGLSAGVAALRDKFVSEYRYAEAELRSLQQDSICAAERADFVKLSILARRLVPLKSRVEALHAVYSELDEVVAHVSPSSTAESELERHEWPSPDRRVEGGAPVTEISKRIFSPPEGGAGFYSLSEQIGEAVRRKDDIEDGMRERGGLAPVIPLRRTRS